MNKDYKVALLISSDFIPKGVDPLDPTFQLDNTLIEKIKSKYNTTIINFDSTDSLLDQTKQSTPNFDNFDTIILMAHGNQDYLVFENDKLYHKTQFDFCNLWNSFMTQSKFIKFAENLKLALKRTGTIWLYSCLTGKCIDSVAQKLAILSDRVVYAPNDRVFSNEVYVIFTRDNKLKLKLIDNGYTRANRAACLHCSYLQQIFPLSDRMYLTIVS
jgi:hypothetical protein